MSMSSGRFPDGRGGAPRVDSTTLIRYLSTIRSHLRLIAACTVLAIVGAIIYVEVTPKSYTATAYVVVNPATSTDTVAFSLPVLHSSGDPTQDVLTAASLFQSPAIARATISSLHLNTTTHGLLSRVTIIPVDQSNVLAVSVKAPSATGAQRIADSYATEIVSVRSAALHAAIRAILPTLQASAAQVVASQRYGTGSVGQEISQLQEMLGAPDPTVAVSSPAAPPAGPTSPKRSLSLLAGLLVGLLVGIGGAFAIEALDPRVRREGQLRERFSSAPVLARIPRRAGRPRPELLSPVDLPISAMEQFRTARAGLLSDPDQTDGRAVLIVSTGPSEGKSTTAVNLAAVLAQGGADVILIDADLRQPSLAKAFGVERFKGTGDVLAGRVSLRDALVPVTLGLADLRVLFADGEGAENAGGLSESRARALVDAARESADFVIVDTSPLLLTSDPLMFANAVDDIILVARVEQTRLSKLDRAWELIVRQRARLTGIIMIGAAGDRDLRYGYGPPTDSGWRAPAPVIAHRRGRSRGARQTLQK